ncbi:MAG: amino acid adenylation domain-containing protein [Cyanobacteria bacterium J06629_18]
MNIEQFLTHLHTLDVKLWLEDEKLRCSAPDEILTPEFTAELQTRKPEIIAFLKQANLVNQKVTSIPTTPRTDKLPLSFAQQRLWFLEQLQPGSSVYHIPTAVRLTGSLNVEVLQQVINTIIQRHEVLRTNFKTVDEELIQVTSPTKEIILNSINLQLIPKAEQEIKVKQIAVEEAQKPFDLEQDLLLRVTLLELEATEKVILLTMHHIISDGWSMEVLVKEIATLYAAFSQSLPSPLTPLQIQYADFAVWQRQWLQGEVLATQLGYWKQQLGGNLPVIQLPTDFPRSRVQSFRGDTVSFKLSSELSNKLKTIAKAQNATLFMTLLAAFKVLLYRYTGQADIVVGSPIANRNRAELEGLIGFFVNTLVLRTELNNNPTFVQVLQRVRQVTWDAYDHQDLPFEKLVEELHPERDLSYNPLFQIKFRLENPPAEKIEIPGLTLSSLGQVNPSAKLDLSLDMYETPDGLVGGFEYNKGLFTETTIKRMVGHFCTLLEGIANQPTQRIGELPLLTPIEQQQILIEWNQTQKEFSQDLCFHQLFEAQVEKNSNAVAIIYNNEQLTYQQLNQRSNQLAHHLQSLGVSPEVRVGICIKRSPEMIVAMLAIHKAGGAYVPLDPAYPIERLAFMVEDAQISLLLTHGKTQEVAEQIIINPFSTKLGKDKKTAETLRTQRRREEEEFGVIPVQRERIVINLDTFWQDNNSISQNYQNPQSGVTTDNLAYLIYTSGSTGKPKGVLIPHRGLTNLTEDKIRVCDVDSDSCILQFFSFSFDASIPEIIMALASGAKLCLASLEDVIPGLPLLKLLREKQVTHITITPSALSALPVEELPALKMVLVGGEAPSPELITKWSQGRKFINAYGPTEVTVNASMVECGNGHPITPVLRSSTNKQLYILDNNLQPLPVGVLGELHIAGVGLARGYLNRPDLTAEKFIPNPFLSPSSPSTPSAPSAPSALYKTGDLACYLPDGSIKLFGRIDNQVKIRGFRIEIGEIEALLNQYPGIQTSVVIVREDNPGDKRLVAYIVPENQTKIPTSSELRRVLKEKLADYMIPAAFVVLDVLPLTPNGKVDTKSLPIPDWSANKSSEFVSPRTPTEEKLVNIFTSVLELETVGVEDDFFELGGHSLLATKLIAQLLKEFDVEITVIDLFEAPTVAELAQRVDKNLLVGQLQGSVSDVEGEREEMEF